MTNEDEYFQQRIELQMELEKLNPIGDDELEQAASLLQNFPVHWERLEGDEEGRHELVRLIVERVYVQDERVVAMTLRSNYHLVLNHKTNGPTEFSVDPLFVTHGSDGFGGAWAQVCSLGREHKSLCSGAIFIAKISCLEIILSRAILYNVNR